MSYYGYNFRFEDRCGCTVTYYTDSEYDEYETVLIPKCPLRHADNKQDEDHLIDQAEISLELWLRKNPSPAESLRQLLLERKWRDPTAPDIIVFRGAPL